MTVAERRSADDDESQRLSGSDRRLVLGLGAPALGLAMTVTVISSYLPVLVAQRTNALAVGVLIAGEGFFGIFMPGLVGTFSDRRAHHVKDRLRLLVPCAAAVVVAVAAIGADALAGAGSFWWYVAPLVLVYAGYYGYLAPYWALYPDLVPDQESGRSRSAESTWRVIGVGLALVGGGLLFDLTPALPFLVAALFVIATTGLLLTELRSRLSEPVSGGEEQRGTLATIRDLARDPAIRNLCVAEGLWNFALSALRAFVVLFFVVGLDRSTSFVSTVIFPLVAVGIAVSAPLSGWVADRWRHLPLLVIALVVYAAGMAVPGFDQASWVIGLIPVVAMGAATVMTLPFSVLMRLLPGSNHGAASGLFGLSRGVGATLGPIVTGAAILVLSPVLSSTEGYAAMWLCSSAALFLSLPLILTLRRDERIDTGRHPDRPGSRPEDRDESRRE
jgi:MFS family permease